MGETTKIAWTDHMQHSKGEDPAEWPEDLRVQEWLEVRS